MNRSLSILAILLTIVGLSGISYKIIDQHQEIAQLEEQLKDEQLKYKMLFRDENVRMAIESGG
ncbi:hypothetical protein [Enterococcus sp. DIV1059_2]|uniref:hypothetical protein n=1 Tax=Enterococcus sp. DIV1059_2 TaxID=2774664 RepID=UPI003F210EE6